MNNRFKFFNYLQRHCEVGQAVIHIPWSFLDTYHFEWIWILLFAYVFFINTLPFSLILIHSFFSICGVDHRSVSQYIPFVVLRAMHWKHMYYILLVKHFWYCRIWDKIHTDSSMECNRRCSAHNWVSYRRMLRIIKTLLFSGHLSVRKLLHVCTKTTTAHSNASANVSRYEWCAVQQFLGGRRAFRESWSHSRRKRDDQHLDKLIEPGGSKGRLRPAALWGLRHFLSGIVWRTCSPTTTGKQTES